MSDLSISLEALQRSRSQLPCRSYFDEDQFREERKLIFESGPAYLGHELWVPAPGDRWTMLPSIAAAAVGATGAWSLQEPAMAATGAAPFLPYTGDSYFRSTVGAAALGYVLSGDAESLSQLGSAGGAGVLALASHAAKATVRAAVNTSPAETSDSLLASASVAPTTNIGATIAR